jgi:hypothetical protein
MLGKRWLLSVQLQRNTTLRQPATGCGMATEGWSCRDFCGLTSPQ